MAKLTFYCSDSDGEIVASHSVYDTAHDAAEGDTIRDTEIVFDIGQHYSGPPYYYSIQRAFLFFDTSLIPADAIITAAVLRFMTPGVTLNGGPHLDIVIRNGQPTYPHDPLVKGDYYHGHYSGNGGSWNTADYVDSGYYEIELNEDGISWIQKGAGAKTKLAIISSRDISKTPEAYGHRYVRVESRDHGLGYEAQLIVTYGPDIITKPATNVEETSATLNGRIVSPGGGVYERGFEWGPTEEYGNSWSETGSFGVGDFSHDIVGLSPGDLNHYRAFVGAL